MSVLLETTAGNIVIDLYVKKSPKTSMNFLKLCKIKYYNFCCFHNVQKDYMIQIGDPTATGKGGSSIFNFLNEGKKEKYFESEIHPQLKHRKKGTVSMAIIPIESDGEGNVHGLVGSQFFITTSEDLEYLDGKYAIFGQVYEGFDVLDKINESYCDEEGRPYIDIRIKHTHILDDPFPDPSGLQIPDRSPLPSKEMLATVRIQEGEELESTLPPEEQEKLDKEREACAQALTLEMIGDLPFAEVKAPEKVLFVCKLNQITQDEDLEMIFSRFGPIVNCEIIRDKLSGQSLSYAFIEYENRKDCETAYFKMDNALIDDRRIHVDFSQSVSNLNKKIPVVQEDKLEKKSHYRSQHNKEDDYDFLFEHDKKSTKVDKKDSRSREKDTRSHRSSDRHRRSESISLSRDKNYKNNGRNRKRRSRSRSVDRRRHRR